MQWGKASIIHFSSQVAQKTYALLTLVSLVKSRQPRDVALIIVAGDYPPQLHELQGV